MLITNRITPAQDHPATGDYGNRLSVLDSREAEVLRLLSLGLTNRQIAERICYSLGTVKNVVQCIIEKLGVVNRAQAAELLLAGLKNGSADNTRQ